MTKEEKFQLVEALGEKLKEKSNIYVADTGGLTVEKVNNLRKLCFEAGIEMQVVKNTLLIKALEAAEGNYEELYSALKLQSAVFFVGEDVNTPGKVIKKFRKEGNEKPILKGAYVDEAIFIGDEQLDTLANLKSKKELIAEIVALLESPIKKVMGQLNSGGNTITGLLKALEERGE